MKELKNGLVVFNATPHPVTFGCGPHFEDLVVVEPDELVNAQPEEERAGTIIPRLSIEAGSDMPVAFCVRTVFRGTEEGRAVIDRALRAGADVIVGSIIAAQAYPGLVVAMVPAPGFERVPPAEKRMRADKFTTFPQPTMATSPTRPCTACDGYGYSGNGACPVCDGIGFVGGR